MSFKAQFLTWSSAPTAAVAVTLLLALLVPVHGIQKDEDCPEASEQPTIDAFDIDSCGRNAEPGPNPGNETSYEGLELEFRSDHRWPRFGRSINRKSKKKTKLNALSEELFLADNEVSQKQYPWHVSLIASFGLDSTTCGGTLVHKNIVVTSRSCITDMYEDQADVLRAKVGNSKKWIQASHACWTHNEDSGYEDDLAAIVLRESVEYGDFVSPICLSSASKTDRVYDECVSVEPSQDNIWEKSKVRVIPMRSCTMEEEMYVDPSEDQSCFFGTGRTGIIGSPCAAESGTGLYCKDKGTGAFFLRAIQSVNEDDCNPDVAAPMLFTDLEKTRHLTKLLDDCPYHAS